MRCLLSLLLLLVFTTPTFAFDPASIGQNTVKEWRAWMKRHGIKEGSLVVAYEGQIVAKGEVNHTIAEPAKVASLSKAITAVCALKALEAREMRFSAPLSEILPDLLAKYPPKDKRFPDITVAHLINQTSGITTRYHRNIEVLRTFQKENKPWQFSKIVKEGLDGKPGSTPYHYSNANFLTLGLVIESLSGEDYETYCTREVLDPAGVKNARLDDYWTVMSSWGGWEISSEDYLKFAQFWFQGEFSPNRPGGLFVPTSNIGRGREYGAGMFLRRDGDGYNAWHNGSWRWRGRINDRFGAYVGLWSNGFSVSTNYAHDAYDGAARKEIDNFLWTTTHP
ncbi:MAG: serine hydrolase domain-containing protein [Pseudomonadota bacterium]